MFFSNFVSIEEYDNIITLYWNAGDSYEFNNLTFFWLYKNSINLIMNNFIKYFSTAPVVAFVSLSLISGLIIEINRFFPDPLIFAF